VVRLIWNYDYYFFSNHLITIGLIEFLFFGWYFYKKYYDLWTLTDTIDFIWFGFCVCFWLERGFYVVLYARSADGFTVCLFILELGTSVHWQSAGTTTETISFWSIFTGVTVFAVQVLFMLCAVCWVQTFVAHFAFEASFVEFVSTSDTFFSCVYRFTAFWAFWVWGWDERHFVWFVVWLNIKNLQRINSR